MMSKKGFYDILMYVKDNEGIHYNEVLKYAFDRKIVESRASITIILNGLTDLGLLERSVTPSRPIRTTYKISKKGSHIINKLKEIEASFSST